MGKTKCRLADWSTLVMDKKQFHEFLTQEGLPAVGTRVGLGTLEELTSFAQGFTTQVQMGSHATPKMRSEHGTPEGTGQSIHTGNMNTLQAVVMANKHYERYKIHILGSVDNVFALAVSPSKLSASRGPAAENPMPGILVDNWTIRGIDNTLSKMQR